MRDSNGCFTKRIGGGSILQNKACYFNVIAPLGASLRGTEIAVPAGSCRARGCVPQQGEAGIPYPYLTAIRASKRIRKWGWLSSIPGR